MTVAYMRDAATATMFSFHKLLFRWKGSVWKLVINELCVWLYIYFLISLFYRFQIIESNYEARWIWVVKYVDTLMPATRTSLTFVLGFYVSIIATRWWKVFMEIPWPDNLAMAIAAFYFDRKDKRFKEEDLKIRSTVIRYLVLAFVLVFRDINEAIRKRFPTLLHLAPNLATADELKMITQEEPMLRYWMPIEWILLLFKAAYKRKQMGEEHFNFLIEQVLEYRTKLQNVQQFDFVNVPLAYTQVVNVAVVAYFGMALIAKQFIGLQANGTILVTQSRMLTELGDTKSQGQKGNFGDTVSGNVVLWMLKSDLTSELDLNHRVDYAIPFFTILEFLFYVGWLKVAQVMINPFGMDDDDFDIDVLVERNINVGQAMAVDFFDNHPPLVQLKVTTLPHTIASANDIENANPMRGSVAQMKVPKRLQKCIAPVKTTFRHPPPHIRIQGSDMGLQPETSEMNVSSKIQYDVTLRGPNPDADMPEDKTQTEHEIPLKEGDLTRPFLVRPGRSESTQKASPANRPSRPNTPTMSHLDTGLPHSRLLQTPRSGSVERKDLVEKPIPDTVNTTREIFTPAPTRISTPNAALVTPVSTIRMATPNAFTSMPFGLPKSGRGTSGETRQRRSAKSSSPNK